MMVLLGFGAVLVVAAFSGKHRSRLLGSLRLTGESLILILFAVQAVVRARLFSTVSAHVPWNPVLPWLLASGVLVLLLAVNWHVLGVPLMLAGLAFNILVVAFNGLMPVSAGPSIVAGSGFYGALGPETVAPFLGDILLAPGPGALILSAGDVLLVCGVAVLVLAATRTPTIDLASARGERKA